MRKQSCPYGFGYIRNQMAVLNDRFVVMGGYLALFMCLAFSIDSIFL